MPGLMLAGPTGVSIFSTVEFSSLSAAWSGTACFWCHPRGPCLRGHLSGISFGGHNGARPL
jgi:hypothetical protein